MHTIAHDCAEQTSFLDNKRHSIYIESSKESNGGFFPPNILSPLLHHYDIRTARVERHLE